MAGKGGGAGPFSFAGCDFVLVFCSSHDKLIVWCCVVLIVLIVTGSINLMSDAAALEVDALLAGARKRKEKKAQVSGSGSGSGSGSAIGY